MAVQLERFYRFVMLEVPGVSDPLVDQALVDAAAHFCNKSGLVNTWNDKFLTTAGESRYGLDIEPGMRITSIVSARVDEYPLELANFDMLLGMGADWRDLTGTPEACYFDDSTQEIVLTPTPTGEHTVEVLCRYVPSYDAKTLPDVLFNKYAPGIAAGAKALLQIQPGQTWSNPQAAQINQALFEDAIRAASAFNTKQGTRMPLRVVAAP